jgi:HK97 family phage major capsid protein
MDITNAAYEGSGTAGGYLVPAQLSATIIEVREEVGIARRVANIQPMTSETLAIPKKTGGLTVYYPAELGTITDSDKAWGQIGLVAEKRAVASKISQELVDDALINIVDNVVSEQAYALALQEDNEMINGTGASTYGHVTGLLTAIGAAGVSTAAVSTTWAALTLGEVMTAMGFLPARFQRNPAIICSHNFYWTCLARLAASGGGNTISTIEGGPTGRQFLGVPVYLTPQMPVATAVSTVSMLFGSFDMAVVLGDRIGIRMGRDDSTGFLNDYTTLKATARYDMKVHEQGDASNAGAYVALKTHA